MFCALVESLPTTLDDNLTVPLAGAVVLPLLVEASPSALLGHPDLMSRLVLGLAINAAFAGFAFWQGSIDLAGGALRGADRRRHHRRAWDCRGCS